MTRTHGLIGKFAFAAAIATACAAADAEIINLANGDKITAAIVSSTPESVVANTVFGQVSIPRSAIANISPDAAPADANAADAAPVAQAPAPLRRLSRGGRNRAGAQGQGAGMDYGIPQFHKAEFPRRLAVQSPRRGRFEGDYLHQLFRKPRFRRQKRVGFEQVRVHGLLRLHLRNHRRHYKPHARQIRRGNQIPQGCEQGE